MRLLETATPEVAPEGSLISMSRLRILPVFALISYSYSFFPDLNSTSYSHSPSSSSNLHFFSSVWLDFTPASAYAISCAFSAVMSPSGMVFTWFPPFSFVG